MKKYYDMLGVAPGAALHEIRKAARRLFIEFHPDMHSENKALYEEKTKKLIEAYKTVLRDAQAAGDSPAQEFSEEYAVENDEDAGAVEALLIKLSNRIFALPTKHIREIVRVGDVRIDDAGLMAEMFPFLTGLFHRRDEIAMLWNLHSQLGLREMPISSDLGKRKIVVVDWDDSAVGFLVDDVGDFVIQQKDSGKITDEKPNGENEFVESMLQTDNGPVGLLNLKKLLYNLPV